MIIHLEAKKNVGFQWLRSCLSKLKMGADLGSKSAGWTVDFTWSLNGPVPNWFRNKVPTSFKYDFLAPYIEIHWMSRHVSVPNHPSLLFGSRIQRIHIWMSQRVVKNEKSKSWG
jgi:hypothetical protein